MDEETELNTHKQSGTPLILELESWRQGDGEFEASLGYGPKKEGEGQDGRREKRKGVWREAFLLINGKRFLTFREILFFNVFFPL